MDTVYTQIAHFSKLDHVCMYCIQTKFFLLQRTGGLFGTSTDPFSSEPSSPTTAPTSQRPLQFSESRPEDVESPPDSVFLQNTEFFPVTPTRTNITNNNANFTEEWVFYIFQHLVIVGDCCLGEFSCSRTPNSMHLLITRFQPLKGPDYNLFV